ACARSLTQPFVKEGSGEWRDKGTRGSGDKETKNSNLEADPCLLQFRHSTCPLVPPSPCLSTPHSPLAAYFFLNRLQAWKAADGSIAVLPSSMWRMMPSLSITNVAREPTPMAS